MYSLKDFREQHIKQLEQNMKVACTIRDDKKSTARDKCEAIKIIARLSRLPSVTFGDNEEKEKKTSRAYQELEKILNDAFSAIIDPFDFPKLPAANQYVAFEIGNLLKLLDQLSLKRNKRMEEK